MFALLFSLLLPPFDMESTTNTFLSI